MQNEPDLPGEAAQLPAVTEANTATPPSARAVVAPEFLSQLLAERAHLPSQRARRRVPLATAVVAYGESERSDRPRLPQGFFRTSQA